MVTGAVAQHDLRVAPVAHPHYVMLARIAARDTRSVIGRPGQAVEAPTRRTLQVVDLGIAARNPPTASGSPWRPTSRCTSAIRRVHGSAARTRTPTDSYASTSPKERTCRCTARLVELCGERTQRAASRDARIQDAEREISSLCCVGHLRRRPEADLHVVHESGNASTSQNPSELGEIRGERRSFSA